MSRYPNVGVGCKVYVGGLPRDASRDELERSFGYYGKLNNVFVARNPPGFAFIEFDDARDAEDSVRALDGKLVCGVRVRVEVSHGKNRFGEKFRDNRRRRSRSPAENRNRHRSPVDNDRGGNGGGRHRHRSPVNNNVRDDSNERSGGRNSRHQQRDDDESMSSRSRSRSPRDLREKISGRERHPPAERESNRRKPRSMSRSPS